MKTSFRQVAQTVIVVVVAVVALVAAAYLIYVYVHANAADRKDMLVKVAVDLLLLSSIFLIALVTSDRFRHLSQIRDLKAVVLNPLLQAISGLKDGPYTKVADIPWESLFRDARNVYLVVQGWDGWQGEVAQPLTRFLKAGGKLHIALPALPHNGESDGPRVRNLAIAAERTGVSIEEQQREIELTATGLLNFAKSTIGLANARKQVTVAYTDRTNWFCGIYFDPNILLISTYQHKEPGKKIGETVVPSFVVNTRQFPRLKSWFATEWEHLTRQRPW